MIKPLSLISRFLAFNDSLINDNWNKFLQFEAGNMKNLVLKIIR